MQEPGRSKAARRLNGFGYLLGVLVHTNPTCAACHLIYSYLAMSSDQYITITILYSALKQTNRPTQLRVGLIVSKY